MSKAAIIEVRINGEIRTFRAGDMIDLGVAGLIEWHPEPVAGAVRVIHDEREKQVREAIAFTEDRVRKEVREAIAFTQSGRPIIA